jgi:outer membrane protein assembly factor BamB
MNLILVDFMKLCSVLTAVLLFCFSACDHTGKGPDPCGDGVISAADAVWSHGEGDLQNSKRASGLRNKGCFTAPETTPTLQWSFEIGGSGSAAAPVIADDGTIYLVGEYPGEPHGGGVRRSGLLAISASGALKWFFERRIDIGGGVAAFYNSAVAVAPDGTVYLGFYDSTLYAINPDGSIKWQYTTNFSFTAPAIDDDGRIYAAGKDTIFCFNTDGTIVWRSHQPEVENGCIKLVLGRERIFIGLFDQGILAIDYKGKKRWLHEVPYGFTIHRGIIVDEKDNIYLKTSDNNLISLNDQGIVRWSIASSVIGFGISEQVLRGDYLYFTLAGALRRIDKNTGKNEEILGSFPHVIDPDASPLIDDNGVIIVGSIGFGASSGEISSTTPLIAAVTQDSIKLWEIPIPNAEYSDFIGYFALTTQGEILCATFSSDPVSVLRLYKFQESSQND